MDGRLRREHIVDSADPVVLLRRVPPRKRKLRDVAACSRHHRSIGHGKQGEKGFDGWSNRFQKAIPGCVRNCEGRRRFGFELLYSFVVAEPEQLVFFDRAAYRGAVLLALK